MKLIRPNPIVGAALVASSVAEDPAAEWSAATTYAKDAIVRKAATHRKYQSLVAGNLNHDPATDDGTRWIDAGPTNRWAMFDDSVGTVTTAVGTFNVQLQPGSIDAIALLDLEAETGRVVMVDSGVTVYDRTLSTNYGGAAITDWYLYFFEPVGSSTTLLFLDLPTYPNATTTVTLTAADSVAGDCVCGTLVAGRQLDIGLTEVSPKVSIDDFSKKSTDDFGITTVVERAWAGNMTLRARMLRENINPVRQALAKVRAKPCVWIGDEAFDAMILYGFYKSFEIEGAYATASFISLTIEGLT